MLGWIVYGNINAVLYGMIMTIGYSLIVDKLMYGIDSRKLLIIVTSNGDNVAKRIGEEIERGVTVADGKGAYTGNSKQILFCTCSKAEVFSIKRIAHECDSKAFVMITSVDAAYGEGFKELLITLRIRLKKHRCRGIIPLESFLKGCRPP